MSEIKIHIFHIGKVCVAPELPFGGEHCSALKASGVLDRKSKRLWLPVSAYLIECAHGNVLFDCGWHRDMSPHGVFERRAQIRSLGSLPLYFTNQVVVESSAAIDEQLAARGVAPVDWDAVLLSHLDCDHANGLKLVADAKKILVSKDELRFAENGSRAAGEPALPDLGLPRPSRKFSGADLPCLYPAVDSGRPDGHGIVPVAGLAT